MSRELWLLRHGKSDWATGALRDFDRPLARRGRKAVKRMGRWVRAQGLRPDLVISSPAERARQTARRFCRFAELPGSLIRWDETIYAASLESLLSVVAACPAGRRRIMLVGHNPGFEELATYLAGGRGPVPMPTAALARLALPDDWTDLDDGCAELLSLTHPRELDQGREVFDPP